jgi:hypothetical protein
MNSRKPEMHPKNSRKLKFNKPKEKLKKENKRFFYLFQEIDSKKKTSTQ